MKIKTLVAVLLLSGGVTSAFAQTEANCNKNSSISHEAVRANNFKDAYIAVERSSEGTVRHLRYLHFYGWPENPPCFPECKSKISNSADYKKYFDEFDGTTMI